MKKQELQNPKYSDAVHDRIRHLKILIMDEVSMIHPNVFEMMESISREVVNSSKCFGGLQIILIGDFLQLAPISIDNSFIFETNVWEKLDLHTIVLTEPHRQEKDDFYILSNIRQGKVDSQDLKDCLIEYMSIKELAHHYTDLCLFFGE